MSTSHRARSIGRLIERSSLGSARARAARAEVAVETGLAIATAAAARSVRRVAENNRVKRQG